MYKGKKIIAIIPARGGSKGIKLKNLLKINNKSLIQITTEVLREVKYIDKIILSSDHESIIKEGKKSGLEVPFIRPKKISGDLSTDFEVMRDFYYQYHREGLDNFTEKPDFVREYIAESILALRTGWNQRQRGYLFQIFFDTKTDEIVNIFSQGNIMQGDELVNLLSEMSPNDIEKWKKILSAQ